MNFAAFDLNLLRVFDALMRERSATRAGERVGLSQPAVSAALSRLRHTLGDELFVRQVNEMVPTPRALALEEPIRAALVQVEQALYGISRFDPVLLRRDFYLLGADLFSIFLMPKLWRMVAGVAPGVGLRLLDTSRGDLDRLLGDDVVDMALDGPLPPLQEWVAKQVLFPSAFVIIAARGYPALQGVGEGGTIPLDLFCSLPHALRSTDGSTDGFVSNALSRLGHKRQVALTLPHFYGIGRAVAEGGLIAAVPIQFARLCAPELGLATYQPPLEVPVPDVSLYWHRRHDQDPAHCWMRELIVAAVQELQL